MKRYMLCLIIAVGLLTACNGGGSGNNTTTPDTHTPLPGIKFTHIDIIDNNPNEVEINDTLRYTAMASESEGSPLVDVTNKVEWEAKPKSVLQLVESGVFTAIESGQATVYIYYQGLEESHIDVDIKGITQPALNYTSLVIGGDIAKESAESGELLNYTATGFTSDNQESDLTTQVAWDVIEPNAPLKHIKDGQFEVESGEGPYTIRAAYLNNPDKTPIESTHTILIKNKPLVLTSMSTYPNSNIIINPTSGENAHYQLQAKGFNGNQAYTLGPDLVQWSVSPTTNASVDESNGYLEVNGKGKFTVTAKYKNNENIESSSEVIVDPLTSSTALESTVTTKVVIGLADQIFYISKESLVKSCPVSTTPSIDSAKPNYQSESNHMASASECSSYTLLGVNPKDGLLNYNKSYNKIYAFSSTNILYSIDTIQHKVKSYTLPVNNIKSLDFSASESTFNVLSSEIESGIESTSTIVQNTITTCGLSADGGLVANSCSSKKLMQFSGDPLETYKLQNSYMLRESNSYLIFNSMIESKVSGKLELMVINCNINFTEESGCNIAIDTTHASDPYNAYQSINISKPSILTTDANNTYIYSVALESPDFPGIYTPNSFKFNEQNNTLKINQSDDNVLDTQNYANSFTIQTYDNIALDKQNKWAYYGTTNTRNVLKKCSYANNQIDSNGKLTGSCLNVTNFKDTFSGIAFVPGNKSNLALDGLDNLFFISNALTNSNKNSYVVAQCAKVANESIDEASCFKYDLPGISATSKLVLNKHYNKLYVTTGTSAIYGINFITHRVTLYKTILSKTKALAFSADNSRVYLVGEKSDFGGVNNLGSTKLYVSNCHVSESGTINKACASINPVPETTKLPTNIDIINYQNKFIYLMLDSTVYKCTIGIKGIYIDQCQLIDIINPNDSINYNTNSTFTHFSALHKVAPNKSFLYLGAITGTNHYVWPALIDVTTGDLSLNSALPNDSSEPSLISNSATFDIGKINFDDTTQSAYVGFPDVDDILSCKYDTNITTNGTIDLHGDRSNCSSIATFKPYQALQLLYMTN